MGSETQLIAPAALSEVAISAFMQGDDPIAQRQFRFKLVRDGWSLLGVAGSWQVK